MTAYFGRKIDEARKQIEDGFIVQSAEIKFVFESCRIQSKKMSIVLPKVQNRNKCNSCWRWAANHNKKVDALLF